MGVQTDRVRTVSYRPGHPPDAGPDTVAVEAPLEIRVGDEPFTTTMRTPGHDIDLAIGLLVAEGVVATRDDVHRVREVRQDRSGPFDVALVVADLSAAARTTAADLRRAVLTSSACGLCGAPARALAPRIDTGRERPTTMVDPAVVAALPDRLRAEQHVFARTGGLHAAGLFTVDGDTVVVREDVGRHNAVDKVVGWAWRQGALPLDGHVLVVSGRASYELVAKCVAGGVPVLVSVSAPSSLAVELARAADVTLAGFVRDGAAKVYTGAHRLGLAVD